MMLIADARRIGWAITLGRARKSRKCGAEKIGPPGARRGADKIKFNENKNAGLESMHAKMQFLLSQAAGGGSHQLFLSFFNIGLVDTTDNA